MTTDAPKKYTLAWALAELHNRAKGRTREDGTKEPPDRALKNFLDTHAAISVQGGSIVWRRLASFYTRGKKQWGR